MAKTVTLGDFLYTLRQQREWSCRKLAKLSGISDPYISQLEANSKIPTVAILKRIAKVYNMDWKIFGELM